MTLGISLDPRETALVVIDMQNGFCHAEGSMAQARGPEAIASPQAIIPNILRMIAVCRRFAVPVWFTRQVHYPGDRGRARHRIASHLDRPGASPQLCWKGSWDTELIEPLAEAVRPEDEVVVKHRASGFYNTPLETELRMRGIQILIVTGTTTSYCVDATVRDAYARDFDVVVPVDCVADRDAAAQLAVLNTVERFHGAVSAVDELELALEAGSAGGTPADERRAEVKV